MSLPSARTITLHEDEDFELAKLEMFGKAYFTCRTIKTQATRANVVGVLKRPLPLEPGQKRRKFDKRYVVSKPNRQEGNRPKARRTFSLDADLIEQAEQRAEKETRCNLSELVEKALKAYLDAG